MKLELRTDQPGIALLVVMLVTMVIGAIAAGAALIGTNSFLISEYDQRTSLLETVADAGLELGRARLNANPSLFDEAGPATLELDAAVHDAGGSPIPGVTRTIHVLPLGGGPGEYGNFATLVAIAEDGDGARVIRRLDLLQESFSVYAYFTDFEPTSIAFGNNDQLFGPVHSNSDIKVRATGATFHGPVTTAGTFVDPENATFHDDTTSGVTPVLMPTTTHLTRLHDRALPGDLAFTPPAGTVTGAESTMRIEFVSRDVDGDMVEEGFIRVYQSTDGGWVTGSRPPSSTVSEQQAAMGSALNCGHFESDGTFNVSSLDPVAGHDAAHVLTSASRQCFLGGDPALTNGFEPTDAEGGWVPWPNPVHPDVSGETDADYLFPIDRGLNPAFRGVIYVSGDVVVSGTVRGRLTLAATGDIIIGDDLVYETDPGSGSCEDMLGLFAGGRIIVADNTVNAPQYPVGSTTYHDFDDTDDEYIHASILALDRFEVENAGSGATATSLCGTDASGNPQSWGRGCLHVSGGLVQQTRGTVAYAGGTGYVKRYTHDTCAFTQPPPYFPSTGHFYRSRYYEIDPTGFNVTAFYEALN